MRPLRRLALVNDAMAFGGAERYLADLARAARRRGIETVVWRLRWPQAECEAFPASVLGETPVITASPAAAASALGLMREFRAMLRSVRPDAIIINASPRPRFWLTAWLARPARLPVLWIHHMVEALDHRRLPPGRLGGRLEGLHLWRIRQALRHQLAAHACNWVVTSGPEDRDRIARGHAISRRKIAVVPPGIDCASYPLDAEACRQLWAEDGRAVRADGSAGPVVVGTACRLVRGKGLDRLVEAIAMLRSRGAAVTGLIAGEGGERDRLTRMAESLGVGNAVRFSGRVSDLPAFYSSLDIHALCSDSESFGLSLTEAMACGRAVISTPTAGGRQQVSHLSNGWLLQGFSAAELAEAIAALAADPALRLRLGARARFDVQARYSIERTLSSLLRLLQSRSGRTPTADLPSGRALADPEQADQSRHREGAVWQAPAS